MFRTRPIVWLRDLFVIYSVKRQTVSKLDLIEGSSLSSTSVDLLQHPQINNNEHWLSFKRPTDKSERQFSTYIVKDAVNNICARLLLLSYYNITSNSLPRPTLDGRESHVAKKNYTE